MLLYTQTISNWIQGPLRVAERGSGTDDSIFTHHLLSACLKLYVHKRRKDTHSRRSYTSVFNVNEEEGGGKGEKRGGADLNLRNVRSWRV